MKPVVVIMAGGAGTRFWPLSTEERPKQFLALTSDRTLIQMSFDRVVGLTDLDRIFVLTSAIYVDLVREQLPELPSGNVVGEPCRRDTAAALAFAALLVEDRFPDQAMVVVTADQVIDPLEEFQRAILEAVKNCGDGVLYTLGISPTYPATQYGYLEMGEPINGGELPHFKLRRFKEKPDLDTAREFLEQGAYYWNSGMFVWKTSDILEQYERHLPEHLATLRPVIQEPESAAFDEAFARLQSISVDFAILEKAEQIQAVIPPIEWDDVGGWQAARRYLPEDAEGNRIRGSVTTFKSSRNTIFSEDPNEELLLLGVEDLVVVRSGGRTLVAHKSRLDDLKAALSK